MKMKSESDDDSSFYPTLFTEPKAEATSRSQATFASQ